MGRPKRRYPLGRYRLRIPKDTEPDKASPVGLDYPKNDERLCKNCRLEPERESRMWLAACQLRQRVQTLNQLLSARVERIDSQLGLSQKVAAIR